MKQALQKIILICTGILWMGMLPLAAQEQFSHKQTNAIADFLPEKSELHGRVTDAATGKPLEGASLFFPDLRTGTATAADGSFTFNYIPSGTYIIDITYQGYASRAISVVINGETQKDFQLSSTVAEVDNVTITGVSKATELRLTPISVSIVKKQELNRSTATNIIEALTRKAGVSALTTGPAIAKPFIRGLGYSRVITLNDGMRQEGQQWGDEHGIEIDEYSVQRAEVVRGPASLIYGSDAIGGVLNIQSTILVPENTIRANLSGSFNGNNNMWGTHADVAGKINGINFSAYGSNKQAGDYQNRYDGYVLNSRFREKNYGASFGINRNWGYSHISISNFHQQLGVIEGDRDDQGKFLLYSGTSREHRATQQELQSRSLLIPNQQIRHLRIAIDNSISIGKGMLSALLGFQHNQRQEFGDLDQPKTAQAFFDLQTYNYNIAYHFANKNGWSTSAGLSGMQQKNKNKTVEALIPNYNLFDAGGYFLSQKTWNKKLSISGGIRLDNRRLVSDEMKDGTGKIKFEAFTKNFANLSASAGLSYAASKKLTLKTNLSRGFRAPNAPELSANGEHEGTNRYEIGVQHLRSETSFQVDLGAEYIASHFTFSLTPFFNRVSQFIFLEKLLATNGSDSLLANVNGDLIPAFKFDQQTANLTGLEFSFDVHPHPFDWLHFENTVTLVRGKFSKPVDGSSNLPLIAPPRLISELRGEWANPTLAGVENIYFKVELDANAKQNNPFAGYGTETATPGYALLNLGIGADLVINKHKWLSINLALNNATDEAYQSHLSRLKYTAENRFTGNRGVYNMGRNFTARLIIPMEFKIKKHDG